MDTGVRVGIDIGGTFTDVVVAFEGRLSAWKLPSTPEDPSEAFAQGLREALRRAGDRIPSTISHATTVATNAVLERRGAVTGLVVTEGFRDILAIGRQARPSLYDLWADRPPPLVPRERCFGVPERIAASGEELSALDEEAARLALEALAASGVESVAVCLLFSFANPAHEQALARLARSVLPGVRLSLSCQVLPEFREYERASTTALDAYIGPVVESYLTNIAARAQPLDAPVVVMASSGGTMSIAEAAGKPVHTLLSGPAAGVRGALLAARETNLRDLVSFDMGGTSTDVCLMPGGEPAVGAGSSVGGLPFRTPSLAVHTIGAGGGSLLWVDPAGALRAGPGSAGACPGPACYGRGGTDPTVTDAHVICGHLSAGRFLGGRLVLDAQAARAALGRLAGALGASVEAVAAAGLAAVSAQMAQAVRSVSVERGHDPRDFALVAFGGAGPMHAVGLAAQLEMRCVVVPPVAGALSALGLLSSPYTAEVSRTAPMLDPEPADVDRVFAPLTAGALEALRRQGVSGAGVAGATRIIECRYRGQAHEVPVAVADPFEPAALAGAFAEAHRARFGWEAPGEPVELVTFRVRAAGYDPQLRLPGIAKGTGARPMSGSRGTAPAYLRESLGWGDRLTGPCLVWGEESTVVVDGGWELQVDRVGNLLINPEA